MHPGTGLKLGGGCKPTIVFRVLALAFDLG
jgi:hypothetical protein